MNVTINTPNGPRSYTFVSATALELFLEGLPEGWFLVREEAAKAA